MSAELPEPPGTNDQDWGFKQQKSRLSPSGGRKSEMEVSAGPGSLQMLAALGESFLPLSPPAAPGFLGLLLSPSSLCLHLLTASLCFLS